MSKKCPNCGYQESDDSTVCHICGSALVEDRSNDDFNYDFGEQPAQSVGTGYVGAMNNDFNVNAANLNGVPMKISDVKAMKYKKNLYSWSTSLIVICVLRFVLTFLSLEDVQDLKELLPLFEGDMLYAPLNGIVTVFYFALVVLVLFLAASIVLTVFAQKVNKCPIPPQDDKLFEHSKKAFYVSIATTVVVVLYFILEICALVYDMQLSELVDASSNAAELAGSIVVDILLVVGAITCLISSLKLSKSKQ
ncbi:MAG: hypothetical protein NC037_01890 [Bacteroides sp.]|nr:hypothetical protein [Bacillota bacterium]MCM1394306.1 hypothetical protein [[Eubacterium] siraeum]MCM1455266.1 hypothetical protein [Bacteroides sp.]